MDETASVLDTREHGKARQSGRACWCAYDRGRAEGTEQGQLLDAVKGGRELVAAAIVQRVQADTKPNFAHGIHREPTHRVSARVAGRPSGRGGDTGRTARAC